MNNPQQTQNIYTSWIETAGLIYGSAYEQGHELKELNKFTLEELAHLKWLIEQEVEVRNARD